GAAVAGAAVAAAVASLGEGDGEPDAVADGEADGVTDGDDDGARVGVVAGGEGLADGVNVGPSASAGVAKDTAKTTARSGGARKRCTCTSHEKSAAPASESGHPSPQQPGEPALGLFAHLARGADPVGGHITRLVLTKQPFRLLLAGLRAHRDHQAAGE